MTRNSILSYLRKKGKRRRDRKQKKGSFGCTERSSFSFSLSTHDVPQKNLDLVSSKAQETKSQIAVRSSILDDGFFPPEEKEDSSETYTKPQVAATHKAHMNDSNEAKIPIDQRLICCNPRNEKVAIIGMGMRYPNQIDDPKKFWRFLANGGDAIREVPPDRWSIDDFYSPDPKAPGKMYVKRGAFLHDDIKAFDAPFFGISPREAETLDSQQRILLEITFEAFQDAGIPVMKMKGKKVGTFIGGFMMDNQSHRMSSYGLSYVNTHLTMAGSLTMLANRISYVFDFAGPSISIDTACSSSLVAVDLACESLRSGSSEVAVAGGINMMLLPIPSITMCKGNFLAKDGRSKAFFDDADGYGRGEGAGVVILKTISAAEKNGDEIYAVLDATSVNQDGRTQGISLPSQDAQIQNMKIAIEKAGIDPSEIDYVEAHGTGTKAGDPLEIGAIGAVYGKSRSQPLPVASVKVNLNHTEAAAGITGLMKAALTVKHGCVLPHMNLGQLNTGIQFSKLNIRIPLQGESWYQTIRPRTAAVNSFGYGGTNAHAIISRYDESSEVESEVTTKGSSKVITMQLSAKSPHSLEENARVLSSWVKNQDKDSDISLEMLACHMNNKRDWFPYICLFRAANMGELSLQLDEFVGSKIPPPPTSHSDKVVWVFTGMGPQWWGMGQELYKQEAAFRSKLDECDKLYMGLSGGNSLLQEMMKEEEASNITDNHLAQSANFFLQVGLASLLMNWGLKPDVVVGHSVGEVAAAVVSGSLDLDQGIQLIFWRGAVLEALVGKGTMLAAGITEEQADTLIDRFSGVDKAAINAPDSIVLSGTKEELTLVETELVAQGVFAKFVRVQVAYHSSQTSVLESDFMELMGSLAPRVPKITLYSTVTGRVVDSAEQDTSYWWKNIRQCVQFHCALRNVIGDGYSNFIEIGPHPVLASSIGSVARELNAEGNNICHTLRRRKGETKTLLANMGTLIQSGVPIKLSSDEAVPTRNLGIPLYSWEKKPMWEEGIKLQLFRGVQEEAVKLPFLQKRTTDGAHPSWKTSLRWPGMEFLQDHQVGGQVVFPGAGYVECIIEAARKRMPEASMLTIQQMSIDRPLILGDVYPDLYVEDCNGNVCVTSVVKDIPTVHMTGQVASQPVTSRPTFSKQAGFLKLSADPVDSAYHAFDKLGLNYGPSFQGITGIFINEDGVFASLEITSQHVAEQNFLVHPSLMDSAFQSLFFAYLQNGGHGTVLPVGIGQITLFEKVSESAFCYGQVTAQDGMHVLADILLLNKNMKVTCEVKSLKCKITESVGLQNHDFSSNLLYNYTWRQMCDDIDTFKLSPLVSMTYSAFTSEEPKEPCQVVLDFRAHEKSHGDDMYRSGLDNALFAFDAIKQLTKRGSDHVKVIVVVLENALIDETKFPVQHVNPCMLPLVGVLRTTAIELPQKFKLVDCDKSSASEFLLQRLLQLQFNQEEVIIREGEAYYGSFERASTTFFDREKFLAMKDSSQPKYYDMKHSAPHGAPVFREYTHSELQDDDILVGIHFASISYEEMQLETEGSVGTYQNKALFQEQPSLFENVGVIEEMGSAVNTFLPGDLVYAMTNDGLKSHVLAKEPCLVKVPDNVPLQEVAHIKDYVSSWLALKSVAHLNTGEDVLVHSDSKQLRLCACAVALTTGAIIHVTAQTREERDALQHLGVHNVYLDGPVQTNQFEPRKLMLFDVMIIDGSQDIPGKTLKLMKTFGRVVVLDRECTVCNSSTAASAYKKNIHIMNLNLQEVLVSAPLVLHGAVEQVLEFLASKKLPKIPLGVVVKADEITEYDASAHNEKSIVIDFSSAASIPTAPELRDSFSFNQDEVAIITGGCSGFGLRSASELAGWGLKHLVLASRRGTVGASDQRELKALQLQGVNVLEASLDVADPESISSLLSTIEKKGLQLSGIVHSATVFHDRLMVHSSQDDFLKAYETKALGAWNLHQATKSTPLKFFICYSSVTACIGNSGQAAYGASNAFLTGLMAHRNNIGMVGTSISWGRIGEVGVMMRRQDASEYLDHAGVYAVDPDKGLQLMRHIVLNGHPHVAIHNTDWERWLKTVPAHWLRFKMLKSAETSDENIGEDLAMISSLMELDVIQRYEAVENRVSESMAQVTGSALSSIRAKTPLVSLGLDSMMAVEMQFQIKEVVGVDVAVMEVIGSSNISELAHICSDRIEKEFKNMQS